MGKKKKVQPKKKGSGSKKAEKAVKKSEDKKKQKVANDRTFGLKNKNKSKRVQKFIKGVKNTATGGKKKSEMTPAEKRKLKKMEEKARERELAKYFGKSAYTESKNDKLSVQDVMEEVDEEVKNQKELTIEEIIEVERAKIISGTKVTEESFKKWKEFRMKMKRTKNKRMDKMINMMSGREMFQKKKAVFTDDNDAEDAEALKIDENLFLDDFDELIEDEEEEDKVTMDAFLNEFDEESSYVAMLWGAVEKKTPKSYLFDLLREGNEKQAVFVAAENDGAGGYKIRCIFEWKGEKREITNKAFVKKKKFAEHTASILAIKFIKNFKQ